ncbi:hypothetical protein CHISP_3418 [Chitinispirillum alkaliphilum]|nr:hypothetical protein CHISP_3418 [Chitinispirillum alkaliphilum]
MLSGLVALWVVIIGIDGMSSILRANHVRKMKNPFRTVYGFLGYVKTVIMIVLAVFNLLMLSKQLEYDKS